MKKKKQYNLLNKIRAALRDTYRYSPMRKEAIDKVKQKDPEQGYFFDCPICKKQWPIQMADVDHEPPLGPLTQFGIYRESYESMSSLNNWSNKLFFGSVQVICKLCHKKKTAQQRRNCN